MNDDETMKAIAFLRTRPEAAAIFSPPPAPITVHRTVHDIVKVALSCGLPIHGED